MSKTKTSFLPVIILCTLLFGFVLLSLQQVGITTDRLIKYYELKDTISLLKASVVDMETGARGYYLTQDKKYLEPYWGGKALFGPTYNTATGLTTEGSDVSKRLKQVELLHTKWTTLTEQLILSGEQAASVTAYRELATKSAGDRKEVVDSIRKELDLINGTLKAELVETRAALWAGFRNILLAAFIYLIISSNVGFSSISKADLARQEAARAKAVLERELQLKRR